MGTSRPFKNQVVDLLTVRVAQVVVDLCIFVASLVAAYLVRFEGAIPSGFYRQLLLLIPYLALARFAANASFGVYRIVWRYVGIREVMRFAQAVGAVSALVVALRLFWPDAYLKVPFGIIVLEGTFTFLLMTAARVTRRVQHERRHRSERNGVRRPVRPTLLVGAGEGGLALAKEALKSSDLGIHVIGFVDDDPKKRGMEIHGLRVLGTLDDLRKVLETTGAHQVLITSSAIPARKILAITDECRALDVEVRIVPGLYEVLGSNVQMRMLREVRIADLLRRDPIEPSLELDDLRRIYEGKRVLVTGAGGSIGSELCRQLLLLRPSSLLLVERDENNLFEIDRHLAEYDPDGARVPLLADINDARAMDRVFRQHAPQAVFHAAAFKHVPVMELFPALAAQTNVLGTKSLIDLSIQRGAESFVMISTDKAVNPTSIMGATKRFAELLVQTAAKRCETRFSCVRFGNVLGSRGSVVGIFQEQIRNGGPVTVTHPDATRYFMTVEEAVNLVLQASTLGENGEVFLLDMGEPVKIVELARQMIRLSGFTEAEIPISFVGTRPGEKLFEELRIDGENIAPTALRKVLRCAPLAVEEARLTAILERLEFLVRAADHDGVREAIRELDIGYAPVAQHVVS